MQILIDKVNSRSNRSKSNFGHAKEKTQKNQMKKTGQQGRAEKEETNLWVTSEGRDQRKGRQYQRCVRKKLPEADNKTEGLRTRE